MNKMKKFLAIAIFGLIFNVLGSQKTYAAATPDLGTARTFGLLTDGYIGSPAGTVTINGDFGYVEAATDLPTVTGTTHQNDAVYNQAITDKNDALDNLNNQACDFTFAPGAIDLATDLTHGPLGIYTPGVYCVDGIMNIGEDGITLDGAGTYIFRNNSTFNANDNASINLTNGASACDVFWTTEGSVNLDPGVSFVGSLFSPSGVNVVDLESFIGRVFGVEGPFVLVNNTTIDTPACRTSNTATLRVVKEIVNDNGGTSAPANFNVHVLTPSSQDVPGSPAPGSSDPGTTYTLEPGVYQVSEDDFAGYSSSFSGACNSEGVVNLEAGDEVTCTITNDDIAPTLTVNKVVINDNGGSSGITNFSLFVNGNSIPTGIPTTFSAGIYTVTETQKTGYAMLPMTGDCTPGGTIILNLGENKVCNITNDDVAQQGGGGGSRPGGTSGGGGGGRLPTPPSINITKVPEPDSLPLGPGEVTYRFTVTNKGTVPMTEVEVVDENCPNVEYISGDIDSDETLEGAEKWIYECTMNLLETTLNTVTANGVGNGLTAIDKAEATVFVGTPEKNPPLVDVAKSADRMSLPVGGGEVTYTYRVTTPGPNPVRGITIEDDKCSPLTGPTGDINNDQRLDPEETWIYECRSFLRETTTNTVTVRGLSDDIEVTDNDFTSVVVEVPVAPVRQAAGETNPTISGTTVPGFPKTGHFEKYQSIYLGSILMIAFPSYIVLRRVRKSQQTVK